MRTFDINNFLDSSFKKYANNQKSKKGSIQIPQQEKANHQSILPISPTDQTLCNIIDTKIYDKLNITSLPSNNNSIEDIIKPLFPNDKVFASEFTSDKSFILGKFIKPKAKKEKQPKKTNYTKILIQNLKKSSMTYDSLKHITVLWEEYITSLMNKAISPDIIGDKFLKADLHGALIEIVSATNKNTIGIKGILLLETKKTFNLLCADNSIKTLLKQGSMFKVHLPYADISINLIANNFMFKSAERTKVKFKQHYCLNKDLFAIYTNANSENNGYSNPNMN